MSDDHRPSRTLATTGRLLPQSGMVDLLSSDHVPEPRGGRDVESQRVFDALRSRIFGVQTGPTSIGRWHILGRLGRGAMGTVYEAHDPELDRRVAVKVLHPMSPEIEAVRRLRLRREAQAMARIKHPNLVEVYDVFADEPQPYVVMELVVGTTLRAWQDGAQRSWRELVAAYLEAARGLAALHAVGLVHRDFKPENAMIDKNGRVRVVDFGLVFAERVEEDRPAPLTSTLTREGLLVGTLSYMSPEQLQGKRGDGRSDQFGLCAALYEAVYSSRPYVGSDPEMLLADMDDRQPPLSPNPGGAPRWLGKALRRGLARQPEQRFTDMATLIAALERGLGQRRRFVIGAVVAAILAALSPLVILRAEDPCQHSDAALDGVWDSAQERALRVTFLAQGTPRPEQQWSRLSSSIQTSRAQWIRLWKQTCPELREATPAPSALHRTRCLDEARLFLKSITASYLEATTVQVLHALEVAAGLAARIQRCSHIGPGAPGRPRPELGVPIQTALLEAEAEQTTGRLAHAEAAAQRAVSLADQADQDIARAEALHRLGRILGHRRKVRAALRHLEAASSAATRSNQGLTRVDARLFAAKLKILDRGSAEGIDAELADLEDSIIGLQRGGLDVRPQQAELHETRGFAARLRGSTSEAIDHFTQALRLHGEPLGKRWSSPCPELPRVEVPDSPLERTESPLHLVRALNNLALAASDAPEHHTCAESMYRSALALADAELGAIHPVSIEVRFDYAEHLGQQDRFDEQFELLRPVRDASAIHFGEDSVPVAEALLALAALAVERENTASAIPLLRRSVELFARHCDEESCPANYGVALLAVAELARHQGALEEAVPSYERACEQLAQRPETAERRVACMYYLAEVLTELGRRDEARTVHAAADPYFQRLESVDDELVKLRQRLNHENNQENKDAPSNRE